MNVLEARRRLLDGEIKKRTAEGENISVRSVSRMRPALTLYGKSEQRTTTGAQLISLNDTYEVTTVNGVTKTPIGISAWKLEGIPKDDTIFYPYSSSNFLSLSKGDYVFSVFGTSKAKARYTIIGGGSSAYIQAGYSQKISIQEDVKLTLNFLIENGVESNGILMIMLNSGSTSLPWEPYTGGKPSPSPDYPQEIKSIGDSGTVNVTLSDGGSQSQTLPIQTPNGLPGIPVDSSGNYTDANGQQWICDEVDFKRGVYVQRCAKEVLTGTPDFAETPDVLGRFMWLSTHNTYKRGGNVALASFAQWKAWGGTPSNIDYFDITNNVIYFTPASTMTVEEVNALFSEMIASENPPYIIGQLATPVETPLSPSELAAYAALRTYSPTTVVSNDAGAWMKLGYKTKKSLEVTD